MEAQASMTSRDIKCWLAIPASEHFELLFSEMIPVIVTKRTISVFTHLGRIDKIGISLLLRLIIADQLYEVADTTGTWVHLFAHWTLSHFPM